MNKQLNSLDKKIIEKLKEIGLPFLRYSLAIVFIWLGSLKFLNTSPATDLIAKTVYWFSPTWFVPFLGVWEVAIGISLLYKPLIRLGLFLMTFQMLGTFLPFIILPEVVFGEKLYILTLEGQYIIKNLVLIAAAIVIGSNVRNNK